MKTSRLWRYSVRQSAEEFCGRKGTGEDELAREPKGVPFMLADLFLGMPLEGSLELQAYIWQSMSGQVLPLVCVRAWGLERPPGPNSSVKSQQ